MGERLGFPHKVSSQTWTNDFVEHKTAFFPVRLSMIIHIKCSGFNLCWKNDEVGLCMRELWPVMPSEIHFKCYNLVGCPLIM